MAYSQFESVKKWLKDSHTKIKCKECGKPVEPLPTSTNYVIKYSCKKCGNKGSLNLRDF